MSLVHLFSGLAADGPALSALLEEIPTGVCLYDCDGRCLLSNKSFTQIVGSVHPTVQQAPSLSPLFARALTGESVIGADVELSHPGNSRRARVSMIPARGARGEVLGVFVVATDQTASVEINQRETLGIVGHDLRNPLAAIRMTAQLLSKPTEMTGERRIILGKRILTSSGRMDTIVKSLLDFSRSREGALLRLEREPVDLAELAARVLEDQTAAVAGRTCELQAAGDLRGNWDAGRLEQIVGQLVSNALRHGADGDGASLVLDGTAPDVVVISTHNRGPVIPPELLPHLFEPFRVGPRTAGTPRRSIGLGLFVIKELTAAHGGSVSVESTDASGTHFSVRLPRVVTGA